MERGKKISDEFKKIQNKDNKYVLKSSAKYLTAEKINQNLCFKMKPKFIFETQEKGE